MDNPAILEQNEKLRKQMLSAAKKEAWHYTETITAESIAPFASDPRLAQVCLLYTSPSPRD